jgi:hypothetical protein
MPSKEPDKPKKKSTRTEKLHKHATLGIKESQKIQNRLQSMIKNCPKVNPIHVPPGTAIAKDYPQQSLQLVLKDFLKAQEDMSRGFRQLQTLFAGEKGFTADMGKKL